MFLLPGRPNICSMLQTLLSSFALVAVSEMGDKTQLLAFSLAARFKRPRAVMAGILVATVLNHSLASSVGQWVAQLIAPHVMALILAVMFAGFGLWTLIPDTLEEERRPSTFGPFLTTTVLFFLAEMGDKTQLATVALSARFQSAVLVTAGTTLGMLLSDGLAVVLGEKFADRAQNRWMRWTAAGMFFAFGIVSAVSAWRMWL